MLCKNRIIQIPPIGGRHDLDLADHMNQGDVGPEDLDHEMRIYLI